MWLHYLWPYLLIATSCCLYATTDGISSGKILSFNTKSIFKCQEDLRIRKENQLKYGHVILPDYLPSTLEYQVTAFKTFTALGKTNRKNLQEMSETLPPQPENKVTCSSSKLDETNRVRIFLKQVYFVEK